MAPQVAGKFEYAGDDGNFASFLKAAGFSDEHVELGTKLKPTLEFSQNGDDYNMKINSEAVNKDIKFKLNQEVSESTPSGKNIKAVYSLNGNHLLQKQTFDNGFEASVDHEFKDDGLTLTYTWKGGKAVRNYKKV